MIAIALLALIAQVASPLPSPSPQASPTPAAVALYPVAPPPGWEQESAPNAPGRFTILAFFAGPAVGDFRPNINVLRDALADSSETLDQRVGETLDAYHMNGAKVLKHHRERVCNGTRDGWYFEVAAHYSGRDVVLEQTLVLDGGFEYVATYTRANGTGADTPATKALDTLCPPVASP